MSESGAFPVVGIDALDGIAALCNRAIPDAPTRDELAHTLFTPEQPAVVRGDPDTGIVATVQCDDGAHIRILVVDPAARGRGVGHALVQTAERDARAAGQRSLVTGADAPFFLWPGVPTSAVALCALFERRHYARTETNFDMRVDLAAIPDDPGGHALARREEREEVDAWMAKHWSNWRPEVLRALDKGNLVLVRDTAGEIAAFCAFEVNRTGFLGPVAVRPDLLGRGYGRAPLIGALHEVRRRGRASIDVVWVGPVVPYAAVGGRISNTYFVYRRELT